MNLFSVLSFSPIYQTMNSTFTMANICPQAPLLNKGFWAKFEAWLRFMHVQNREFEVLTRALTNLFLFFLFVMFYGLDFIVFGAGFLFFHYYHFFHFFRAFVFLHESYRLLLLLLLFYQEHNT